MRIVAGRHRGRRLAVPPGRDIRPTADRVREALFNMLEHGGFGPGGQSILPGARVLDAFCGSGALAFEALSRGAASATLLDMSEAALAAARENGRALGEAPRVRLLRRDPTAPGAAPGTMAAHGLAFLDPPYGSGLAWRALSALDANGWFAPDAVAVLEIGAKETVPEPPPGWTVLRERRYGAARLLLLRRVSAPAAAPAAGEPAAAPAGAPRGGPPRRA